MKIKTINQIASTKTLTDKYGICSDENGNTNSFALADIVEPINNLKNEVGKIKVNGSGIESISYSELVALRNENKLVPGQMYRIIDYVTTTTQDKTKSANHPFDIIVTALNENTLDEKASAIAHEEDTYFDGNDLSAWELWYDLDNDTEKYEWADATNGKGVIYRMIDEKRNDCPYDFKNILFYNDKYTDSTTTDKYYFTFSYVVSGVLYDGTVEKQVVNKCYGNEMGVYINFKGKNLNRNVFRNTGFSSDCHSNTFGDNCYSNTFGNYCYSNKFGNSCGSNKFGNYCYSNTFGNSCDSNTFGGFCNSNTFGNSCDSNTFGSDCHSNTFGDYCNNNTFGADCDYNTFGNNCNSRHIDSDITSITRNDEYYDDSSGQLVPIKHPDLSTQPSILPYKFMGQYVYEQLIPVKIGDRIVDCDFIVEHPMILSAGVFGVNSFKNIDIIAKSDALLLNTESELAGYINVKYTDGSQLLPSNGYGYGYGYEDNNTGLSILIDFGSSSDGTIYTYDPNTEVLSLYKSGKITTDSIPQNLPKKNIILGDSVTSIGSNAFKDCIELTSISIPNSVTSIASNAFEGCSSLPVENDIRYADWYLVKVTDVSLQTYIIKDGTRFIGPSAFRDCNVLTSLTIPNSVTSIGSYAFNSCDVLTSLTIPNSVTSIGDHAFAYCKGLTSISISNSVTSIGHYAFWWCSSLTSISIPNSVTSIEHDAFQACTGLTSVTIPNSVTSIGEKAFLSCSSLTSLTIPNSVTSIGEKAFSSCDALTSITCEAIIPPTIQATTFNNLSTSIPVYVPSKSIDAYKSTQYWSNFTNIQSI